MNYLEFLAAKDAAATNKKRVYEAFKDIDIDKAHKLILDIFKKKISKNVSLMGPIESKSAGNNQTTYMFVKYEKNGKIDHAWTFNYKHDNSSAEVYSIDFFDGQGFREFMLEKGAAKSKLTMYTLGSSIAYFIPVICHIVLNDDYGMSASDAKRTSEEVFKESREWWYGAQKYNIVSDIMFEKLTRAQAEMFRSNGIPVDDDEIADDAPKKIAKEYEEIQDAVRGKSSDIGDIDVAVKKDVKTVLVNDEKTIEAEESYNKGAKDPNQAFKEMYMYIKSVCTGVQPGLIVCGMPGVGKTYRIMKQVKSYGYVDGENMYVIKGKCSTRSLYTTLYEYRDKGKLVVIDDADGLIGPKAPEECINILKAALDSSSDEQGRKVSYKVTGTILDDDGNEVPKVFYTKGGCIVITNYSVGQLDSAVRGRVFTQELDFTPAQLLNIIKELIPTIDADRLTMESKNKAYKYLMDLAESGSSMEISIRSFATCARIFMMCDGDPMFTEDDARSMIKEQMENQARKDGKHF